MGFVPDGISLSPLAERINGRIVPKTSSRENQVTAFGVLDEKLVQVNYWFKGPGAYILYTKGKCCNRVAQHSGSCGPRPATDSGLQWMALNRTDRWTTILRNQVSVSGDKIVLLD